MQSSPNLLAWNLDRHCWVGLGSSHHWWCLTLEPLEACKKGIRKSLRKLSVFADCMMDDEPPCLFLINCYFLSVMMSVIPLVVRLGFITAAFSILFQDDWGQTLNKTAIYSLISAPWLYCTFWTNLYVSSYFRNTINYFINGGCNIWYNI